MITRDPEVGGGVECLENTRIPVFIVVNWRKLGWSDADILGMYTELNTGQLNAVWDYYTAHKTKIDNQIKRNECWFRD